jgi:hypothetical protein
LNNQGGTLTLNYNDIQNGIDSISISPESNLYTGNGNIAENPQFVGTGEFPYSLSNNSPCINAGTPDTTGLFIPPTDLAGSPRIWNNRIDMGAYEWNNVWIQVQDSRCRIRVFPNPTSGKTMIRYLMPYAGYAELKVFDLMGKKVEVLVNEWQEQGEYSVSFDASELSAGVYISVLTTENEVTVTRIIKV